MRELTPGEILSLREFLTMETTGLVTMRAAQNLIKDTQLSAACSTGVQAGEARIRAIQQFIQENGVDSVEGVQ